jgi:hypothetical protein
MERVSGLNFNREAFDLFIKQRPFLQEQAEFYAQFAMAVHEVCQDPSLARAVRTVEMGYNESRREVQFTIFGGGYVFKLLVNPLGNPASGFHLHTQVDGTTNEFYHGPVYEAADEKAFLTKERLMEALPAPYDRQAYRGNFQENLGNIIRTGLHLALK